MLKYNFPKNLKNLRKINKLSQNDLAQKLGVTRQSISYYETGHSEPNLHFILQLSSLFNCSVDDLLFDECNNKSLDNSNLIDVDKINSLINLNLEIVNSNKIIDLLEKNKIDLYKQIDDINKLIDYIKKYPIDTEHSEELSPFDISKLKSQNNCKSYEKNKIRVFNCLDKPNKNTYRIPKLNIVSYAKKNYLSKNIDDYFNIKIENINYKKDSLFILQIKDDSMNKLYKNKDYVLCTTQCDVNKTYPSVSLIDDEEVTIKYIEIDKNNNTFTLIPSSLLDKFKPITYSYSKHNIETLGYVIGVIKKEN